MILLFQIMADWLQRNRHWRGEGIYSMKLTILLVYSLRIFDPHWHRTTLTTLDQSSGNTG